MSYLSSFIIFKIVVKVSGCDPTIITKVAILEILLVSSIKTFSERKITNPMGRCVDVDVVDVDVDVDVVDNDEREREKERKRQREIREKEREKEKARERERLARER